MVKLIKLALCYFATNLLINSLIACSCDRIHFCNELQNNNSLIAFKGIVFDTVTYNNLNQAVYIKVIKVYKDGFGLTDTIKLYGKSFTADCSVDVINTFKIGDTIRLLAQLNYKPDGHFSPPNENYYENYLSSCATEVIIQDGDLVRGSLFKAENGDIFYEYPLSKIEQALEDCNFDQLELKKFQCGQNTFEVYPNPTDGSYFQITSKLRGYIFDKVRLYSINGTLVREYPYIPFGYYSQGLEVAKLPEGVYIVEIICSEQRIVKKLIIQ